MSEFVLKNLADGKIISLSSYNKFTIGRGPECNLVFDKLILSRKHVVLDLKNEDWYCTDTSNNGTFINSQRITKNVPVILKVGDCIMLAIPEFKFEFMNSIIEPAIIDAFAEDMVIPIPATVSSTSAVPVPEKKSLSCSMLQDELLCGICTEIFVKAVTLNCAHTFCEVCIAQWKNTNQNICPICRTPITVQNYSFAIDNIVEKVVNSMSPERKKERDEFVKERTTAKAVLDAAASSQVFDHRGRGGRGRGGQRTRGTRTTRRTSTRRDTYNPPPTIEISSSSDDDIYSELADDTDSDESGARSHPYMRSARQGRGRNPPPYGACYICHDPNHWASNCPFNIR